MIEKTEAVVLRSVKYGDTSKIVTLYTRRFGKISVIAKGARSKKSAFGSALEPMSYIQAVFYRKESRDVQTLSHASHIDLFRAIAGDERKLIVGLCIIEFLHASIHDQEEQQEVFDLLYRTLKSLNDCEHGALAILVWFLVRLAANLGFALQATECGDCNTPFSEKTNAASVLFDARQGVFYCQSCARRHEGLDISAGLHRELLWLISAGIGSVPALRASTENLFRLLQLIYRHMKNHIAGMKTIRSLHLLEVTFS